MKFQHIAVWVADKEESCTAKFNSLCYSNSQAFEVLLDLLRISNFQSDMGKPSMLFWMIHQYIVRHCIVRCIEYEVDVYTRRMLHNGHGFWSDWPCNKLESQFCVKGFGNGEISDSKTNVIDACNFFQDKNPLSDKWKTKGSLSRTVSLQ